MGNPALEEAEEIKKLKENLAANGDSFDEWLLMTAKYTNQVYEGNEVVEETSIETPSFWDKFKYAWVTTWKLIRQQERAIKKSERKQQMLLKDVKRRQTTTQSLSVIRSVFPWAVVIGTVVCIYLIYQSQPEWIVHVWKKIDG